MEQIEKRSGKKRLGTLWRLSWPAIMEQILTTLVSYVDTAMVGVLGAAGTAAVSVNAAPIWLAGGILMGVGVGYSVQVSNAIGAGEHEKVRTVVRQSVLAMVVTGLTALAVFQGLSPFLPQWLGAKPEVLPHAVRYLRLYTMAMPFVAGSNIFSAILRCMGNTKTPLYVNTAANLLNIVLNFFLIYPTRTAVLWGVAFTVPGAGLGVAGAAIASAIALSCAGLALLLAGTRQGCWRISLREDFRPDRAIIRQAVRLGVPTAAERATVNIGQVVMTAVVASLSTVSLAANHIAVTAEGLCYLPAYGISYAGIALVGQAVGAGSEEDAQTYGGLAARLGFLLTVGTGAALFLGAPFLAGLFNTDPEVVAQAALMLRIVSVSEPFFALSIILSGTLRGAHDARYPMVVSLFCMWCIRVPLAPLLVYRVNLGLAGVWIAMSADLVIRGILCLLRWRSGKWKGLCGLAPNSIRSPSNGDGS